MGYLWLIWNAHQPVEEGKVWNIIVLLPYPHFVENKTQGTFNLQGGYLILH